MLQAYLPELLIYLAAKQQMLVVTDQTDRKLIFTKIPHRIISLVPSQTELLYALGLDQEIIGITKFCVHPQSWFRSKTRIGGTKSLDLQLIRQLKPDLIIANKEENDKDQVEELILEFPVYTSDVSNLTDAFLMIADIGILSDKVAEASKLIQDIATQFSRLSTHSRKLKAIYLIWKDPYMTVGGNNFINTMMELSGFENLYSNFNRYPQISLEEIVALKPEVLLLSSEPFPFSEKHVQELRSFIPATQIFLVDGELFSWYGSRLLKSPSYFIQLQEALSLGSVKSA